MAKSLGQIHTVNYKNILVDQANNRLLFDLAGQLTKQLQHMVRTMSTFKLVGIDIIAQDYSPAPGSGGTYALVDGNIRYFAPTKGRVDALKMAYTACRKAMRLKAIDPTKNINYDFRPILGNPTTYASAIAPVWPEASPTADGFKNTASLELLGGLPEPLCIIDPPVGVNGVFETWNQGIEPRMNAGAPDFSAGYDIFDTPINHDYVINEDDYLESLDGYADETLEEIPFSVSWEAYDPLAVQGTGSTNFEWRPDPALYISVLTGQLDMVIDNVKTDDAGGPDIAMIDVAFHVAGWKSILGKHKKPRRSKRRKSHGRKRRSKK